MKHYLLALTIPVFLSPLAFAEQVSIPIGQSAGSWQIETPQRGLTKTQVESKFGAPSSVAGPNGQPPIYYWEYPDFTVYFEAEHVIHSVVKHRSP